MKIICIIVFLLAAFTSDSQTQTINSISANGILLDKGWKFITGDDINYAKPSYDDTAWHSVILSDYITYLILLKNKDIGWFRLHLTIGTSLRQEQLALQLSQLGASEIYLNGKLYQRFGFIQTSLNYKSFNPVNRPFLLPINIEDSIIIAIRFVSHVPSKLWLFTSANGMPLTVTINSWNNAILTYQASSKHAETETKFSYLFVALSFLFILLFIFFPSEKINLFFGMFCFFAVTRSYLVFHVSQGSLDITNFEVITYFLNLNDGILGSLQISIICYAVFKKIPFFYRLLILGIGIDLLLLNLFFGATSFQRLFDLVFRVLTIIGFFYLSILAFRKKIYTIGTVAFFSSLLNLTFFLFFFHINSESLNSITIDDYVRYALTINFIMTTTYVAINFARKSKNLEVQLVEIDKLSKDNLKQEKEKQQLLASQNEILEQQVTQRTFELTQSFENLKSTQAQLIQSEKMASLGELTAGIAHEIQNPLNFVNNFSEVNKELIEEVKSQKSKLKSEELDELLDDIAANEEKINYHGKRADAIVKGMLQHSRSSVGAKEPTDINALCDEYLRLSYHGLRAKDNTFNAEFKTDFDNTIGNIHLIPQDIGRVLLNLFNNAFYAVKEKQASDVKYEALVVVSTRKTGNSVRITVSDNGNGISSSIVDKIFQPFFTTKPTGQGTGLGLSLSYDIVRAHGGEIKVESKEGEGTMFVIQLPIIN